MNQLLYQRFNSPLAKQMPNRASYEAQHSGILERQRPWIVQGISHCSHRLTGGGYLGGGGVLGLPANPAGLASDLTDYPVRK